MNEDRVFELQTGERIPVGTMYCIGRNYADHAREMNAPLPEAPLVFLKPPAAFISDGSVVSMPLFSSNIHHEVELVVVIGKDVESITPERALSCVAGYGVGIDFTARDIQAKAKENGEPWAVSKGFKGSAPVSVLVPAEQIEQPSILNIALKVNGQLRQRGQLDLMERSVEELICYVAGVFSLRRGDCIFTGTPAGVSKIEAGDEIEAEIEGRVNLRIRVK